ncbi:MAG: tetratricopeptide repeat protein [Nitrospirae bacterium]|nr:tetratricopeptide repeat protein [Candidatus Manganitrophaceae bacterium]
MVVLFRVVFVSFCLALALLGCQKKERIDEKVGEATPPPPPAATAPAAPSAGAPPPSPPGDAPHGSGAPAPFMQKLAEYKARLEKNPKDIEALVFMGNANYDIQRFEKAKEFYQRALDVDPNNNHVRTDLASSYRSLGETDQALEELNKVLKVDPNHEVALYNSGIIYLNDKNDPDKARVVWEKLVQLKPNDPLSEELKKQIKELTQTGAKPKPSAAPRR